jgi:hypothetical protein
MTSPEYPERTFTVMPTIGKFIVHITKYYNHRSGKLDYYVVMIGNNHRNACVNIRAPYDSDEPMVLSYVTSEVACTLDNITPMKGSATVQMIQLGITIARELAPKSTQLELEDCSNFRCSSPEGDVRKMALPSFYIAFHGKTWYEDKFGAVLKDPDLRAKYEEGIRNLDNPELKPKTFRFLNKDISDLLYDMYDESRTWNEFFSRIEKKYGNKKCWVVQPWVEEAMRHVFGGLIYEMKKWIVELKNVPTISYYELSEATPMLRGGWNDMTTERVMQRTSFYPDFQTMSYKKALRGTRSAKRICVKTRRNATRR